MSLFDRLFSKKLAEQQEPDIRFGRYTDSYKTAAQYEAWDQSLEAFEQEDYIGSYRSFFSYIHDAREGNVVLQENGEERIEFELYQGSKKVVGFANAFQLKASATVAHADDLHIGFMRRLIEQNYDLKYSRFALAQNNDIQIIFDTYTLDGSPYKLYYALKEVATNADKQDDLLINEFPMLKQTQASHLRDLPREEKEVKYRFITEKIQSVFREMDHGNLDGNQYPLGVSYLLLDLCYRLDYLAKPEGFMMESLERMHRQFFAKDEKNTAQKNQVLRKEFEHLLERPKEELFKELYIVRSTFGITNPVNHDALVNLIDGELHNMDWFVEHGHEQIALAIPGYLAGYSLFYYAVPKPDRDFLHLYLQITEPDYFSALGFPDQYYRPEKGQFDKRAIRRAIKKIVETNQDHYPKMRPTLSSLRFDNLAAFAKSYLLMVRNLDVTKVP